MDNLYESSEYEDTELMDEISDSEESSDYYEESSDNDDTDSESDDENELFRYDLPNKYMDNNDSDSEDLKDACNTSDYYRFKITMLTKKKLSVMDIEDPEEETLRLTLLRETLRMLTYEFEENAHYII